MRVLGWALVWGLIGLIGGYAAAVGIGIVLFDLFSVSQREGAAAMGLVFVIGPFVACIAAVAAATTAAFVTHGRERRRDGGRTGPRRPWGRGLRALVGAALGIAGGYGAAVIVLAAFYALRGSPYFSSYAWALAAAWAPFAAAAAGGGLGLWIALRGRGEAGGVSPG